jgi:hypothetical protein
VKAVPVPRELPPVEAEYQLMVPAEAVDARFTVPESQVYPEVTVLMVGMANIVAVTVVLAE